jgi:fucose permease
MAGLAFAAIGWAGSALTYSVPVFVTMLVPAAIGIGLCNATLSALVSTAAGPQEQGRVQGAAGALESLGRTMGPVWGNAVLEDVGEGAAYGAAATLLVGALAMTSRYHPVDAVTVTGTGETDGPSAFRPK